MFAALPYGFILLNDPERRGTLNAPALVLIGFVFPLLMAALGHFMLKGRNWARLLFCTMIIPYSALLLGYQMGALSLLRVITLIAFTLLLSQFAAQRFFAGRDSRKRRVAAKPPRAENTPIRSARYQY